MVSFNAAVTYLAQYWQRRIYHVAPQDNWALYWEADYASRFLRQRYGLPVTRAENVWPYHHQIIHFIDRYMYLNGPYERLHPSNTLFLTWYHGDLPSMSHLFETLLAALPRLQRVITSCQLSRHSLTQAGLPDDQIAIIPIGIDLTKFSPPSPAQRQAARAKYGVPEDALCIGSFQKDGNGWEAGETPKLIKGPDVFLECIAQLARHYPNLYVLLTGPARGYVKSGLQKIGVRYSHSFLQDYYQVAECYHALDAYLITSRNEGGPKALMESWATSTPLVSTKVGMCADWMHSGQNGMLAEVEDVTGLVEGVRALWEDSDLRARCTQQGLADVPSLDWSALVALYYDLYQPHLK